MRELYWCVKLTPKRGKPFLIWPSLADTRKRCIQRFLEHAGQGITDRGWDNLQAAGYSVTKVTIIEGW